MKQGTASHSGPGARKREPIPHAVSPGGASQIGESLGNHVTDNGQILRGASMPLYPGRGYEAPMNKSTQHHKGSQGRHD